jgi:magnesium transporter
VLKAARYVEEEESVEFGEIHVFVGSDFVVTARHGEASELREVRRQLEDNPDLLRRGPSAVLYTIMDRIVEDYEPVADGLENDIDPEVRRYLHDVQDRVLRVTERVQGFRELLTNILSVNLTFVGINQNDQMKKISAWAAVVIVPTLIAGIYGMNFDYMPELQWRYGYLFALSLMALIALGLYVMFRGRHWL